MALEGKGIIAHPGNDKNRILVACSKKTATFVDAELKKRGVTYCEIIEKYNTVPKPTRIENEKHIIKRQLVFPEKGMYGINTDMGKFMENLTLYNETGTNPNDDAPDSCALFGSEIIEECFGSSYNNVFITGTDYSVW